MLNEILKKLRIEKGVTQQDVADYLNIKRPTYTRYESGTNEPDVQTITKLAQFFDVSTDYLLGYDSQKEKPIETDEPEKSSDNLGFAFSIKDGVELTDEDIADIWKYIDLISERRKKK